MGGFGRRRMEESGRGDSSAVTTSRICTCGCGREFESRLVFSVLAPHIGHVSNFRRPVGPMIEPVNGHCFQSDPCEPLAGVHGGHPAWTRLELAREAGIVSGCALTRPES